MHGATIKINTKCMSICVQLSCRLLCFIAVKKYYCVIEAGPLSQQYLSLKALRINNFDREREVHDLISDV